jgi:hypothetical protein
MSEQTRRLATKSTETKRRSTLIKFLIIVFTFWLSAKMFRGPYMDFIREYFSAIILPILLALIVQLIAPKRAATPVLVGIFVLLSLVEITYKFMPSLFTGITFSFNSVTIIGSSYSINMIPYYGVGAFIGYFILRACKIK